MWAGVLYDGGGRVSPFSYMYSTLFLLRPSYFLARVGMTQRAWRLCFPIDRLSIRVLRQPSGEISLFFRLSWGNGGVA